MLVLGVGLLNDLFISVFHALLYMLETIIFVTCFFIIVVTHIVQAQLC